MKKRSVAITVNFIVESKTPSLKLKKRLQKFLTKRMEKLEQIMKSSVKLGSIVPFEMRYGK